MSDARQPSLSIGGEIVYPGVPFGTIRFEISPSPVSAAITTQAVMSVPAFVMKIFEPSIDPLAALEPRGRADRRARRSRRPAR